MSASGTTFSSLGGHSLLLLQLWDQISKTFGQVYPLNLIYQNRTIEQMAALLQQGDHDDEATTSPSISVGVNNDRPVVFGLNYALAMARYLDDVPIYALAGYEKLVMECDSIEEMAKVNVERMREHQKNGPYRLSGFCGMALVAFEMARLLHQQGGEISLLVLIEPSPVGSIRQARRPTPLRASPPAFGVTPLQNASEVMAGASSPETNDGPARLAVKTNAVVPLSRELEVESRMEKAVLAYSPQAYPGRVALLVSREYLNETNRKLESVWSTLAAGGVDVRVTTGHHLTVFDEPHVWTLANEFTALYQESLPAKACAESFRHWQQTTEHVLV